jgi:excinuclease UvrABC helicase subunit UvrB
MLDIYSSTEKVIYRLIFNDTTLELIQVKDALTYKLKGTYDHITIWPATQFLQNTTDLKDVLARIEKEML